jgi:hypothetical protein
LRLPLFSFCSVRPLQTHWPRLHQFLHCSLRLQGRSSLLGPPYRSCRALPTTRDRCFSGRPFAPSPAALTPCPAPQQEGQSRYYEGSDEQVPIEPLTTYAHASLGVCARGRTGRQTAPAEPGRPGGTARAGAADGAAQRTGDGRVGAGAVYVVPGAAGFLPRPLKPPAGIHPAPPFPPFLPPALSFLFHPPSPR